MRVLLTLAWLGSASACTSTRDTAAVSPSMTDRSPTIVGVFTEGTWSPNAPVPHAYLKLAAPNLQGWCGTLGVSTRVDDRGQFTLPSAALRPGPHAVTGELGWFLCFTFPKVDTASLARVLWIPATKLGPVSVRCAIHGSHGGPECVEVPSPR